MNNIEYYKNTEITNNILNSMRFRNNAFLNVTNDFEYNVHNVVVSNISNILKNMIRFHFFDRKYNIYSSVARYDWALIYKKYGFPPFSFNLSQRKIEGQIFNNNYDKYVLSYDLVLDFDTKNSFSETYKQVALIKNQFDIYEVPYILRFSGSGFHIIVPYKFLPEWFDKNDINTYKRISSVLKDLYDLSSLDMSIYDGRRVIKTAYSIDNKTGYVCLPLTDIEFKQFSKTYCRPENVLKMPDLYYRNSVLRNGNNEGLKLLLKERCGMNG